MNTDMPYSSKELLRYEVQQGQREREKEREKDKENEKNNTNLILT